MRASAIVPVRNGAATLGACLAALRQQTPPLTEIIVVDDGSTDATAAIARAYPVQLVQIAPAGPATARNVGAQHATGDCLLFTDADCAPAPDWAAQLTAPLADPQVTGVKGAYRTRQTGLIPRFVQQEYQDKHDRTARRATIDFVDTYAAAYRRAVFVAQGGFATTFPTPSVEDHELAARLVAAGHKLVFAPRAIVYHQHDATMRDYAARKLRMGYWKMFLLRRHPRVFWGDSHTPLSQRLQIVWWPVALALTCGAMAWPPLRGLAGLAWAAFYALSVPFLFKVAQRDPLVLLVAPLMLLLRAVMLAVGLAAGWWASVGVKR